MTKFFITKKLNQNQERLIHRESCLYIADNSQTDFLGIFADSYFAIEERNTIEKTNGCFWCCREIHSNNHIKIIY